MSKQNGTSSRLSRCVKAPLRMLRHACDAYVRGMNSCADRAERSAGIGYPIAAIPRNYSFRSSSASSTSSDDLKELIRAASVARDGSRFGVADPATFPRSQSVAVGRIDEDSPCDFPADVKVGADLLVARSRSVAVGPKRRKVRSYI